MCCITRFCASRLADTRLLSPPSRDRQRDECGQCRPRQRSGQRGQGSSRASAGSMVFHAEADASPDRGGRTTRLGLWKDVHQDSGHSAGVHSLAPRPAARPRFAVRLQQHDAHSAASYGASARSRTGQISCCGPTTARQVNSSTTFSSACRAALGRAWARGPVLARPAGWHHLQRGGVWLTVSSEGRGVGRRARNGALLGCGPVRLSALVKALAERAMWEACLDPLENPTTTSLHTLSFCRTHGDTCSVLFTHRPRLPHAAVRAGGLGEGPLVAVCVSHADRATKSFVLCCLHSLMPLEPINNSNHCCEPAPQHLLSTTVDNFSATAITCSPPIQAA